MAKKVLDSFEGIAKLLKNHVGFKEVLQQCCPEALKRVVEQDREAQRLLREKFVAFALAGDTVPMEMRTVDLHPVGGDVIAWAVQPKHRGAVDEWGRPRPEKEVAERTCALLQQATSPTPVPILAPTARHAARVDHWPFH